MRRPNFEHITQWKKLNNSLILLWDNSDRSMAYRYNEMKYNNKNNTSFSLLIFLYIFVHHSHSVSSTFQMLPSLIYTSSSLSPAPSCYWLAGAVLLYRSSFPLLESQNIYIHCQKCCTFITWKNLGHLVSQSEFCWTMIKSSLKLRKWWLCWENVGKWHPYSLHKMPATVMFLANLAQLDSYTVYSMDINEN